MEQITSPRSAGRSRPRLGLGTVIAIAAAAAIVYGQVARPAAKGPGNLVYEADAAGHLRWVASPSQGLRPHTPLPPLWKPEVSFMLKHGAEVHLTGIERGSLTKLDAQWRREQAALRLRLAASTTDASDLMTRATPDKRAALTLLTSHLGDYSALSQEYDARRNLYWVRALALLTERQRKRIDRLRAAGDR